eukprot:4383574-Pyramimonas_sp.AAC.1
MRTLPLAPSVELIWGHDPREECAEMARGRYANFVTGAFGGAPMGPREVPKWDVPKWGGAEIGDDDDDADDDEDDDDHGDDDDAD